MDNKVLLKEIRVHLTTFELINLIFLTIYWYNKLDHVFHTNIIAYCQQNRYVRLAICTDLFTLSVLKIKKKSCWDVRKMRLRYLRRKVILLCFENFILKATSIRNSHPDVFCKKGVLRNFVKFPGKHLCQSLFFNRRLQLY